MRILSILLVCGLMVACSEEKSEVDSIVQDTKSVTGEMMDDASDATGEMMDDASDAAGEMMDGLGLAETTPGPLILVTEFVGFVAAFKAAGLWHGIAGAMVALWATFTPCFLWIFVGAPYLEWLTSQARLRGALHSIMAAVVGVIANLFVWFTLQVLFAETAYHQMGPVSLLLPDLASLNWRIFGLAIIGGWMAFIRGLGLAWILGTAAAGGILIHLLADQL